jgi:hypothetical protein
VAFAICVGIAAYVISDAVNDKDFFEIAKIMAKGNTAEEAHVRSEELIAKSMNTYIIPLTIFLVLFNGAMLIFAIQGFRNETIEKYRKGEFYVASTTVTEKQIDSTTTKIDTVRTYRLIKNKK